MHVDHSSKWSFVHIMIDILLRKRSPFQIAIQRCMLYQTKCLTSPENVHAKQSIDPSWLRLKRIQNDKIQQNSLLNSICVSRRCFGNRVLSKNAICGQKCGSPYNQRVLRSHLWKIMLIENWQNHAVISEAILRGETGEGGPDLYSPRPSPVD